MNVETEDEAREYLEERGARVLRTCSVEETLEVRWAVFRTIASHMDSPLEFTGSIQHERGGTLYWDNLPRSLPHAELDELQALLNLEEQVHVMFEACRVPALVIETGSLMVATLEGEDVYILPMDFRWVMVMTHEAEHGPFLLNRITPAEGSP